jgi:hypothetical protein
MHPPTQFHSNNGPTNGLSALTITTTTLTITITLTTTTALTSRGLLAYLYATASRGYI